MINTSELVRFTLCIEISVDLSFDNNNLFCGPISEFTLTLALLYARLASVFWIASSEYIVSELHMMHRLNDGMLLIKFHWLTL